MGEDDSSEAQETASDNPIGKANNEELPNTGIATNNLTIPAALAAFFGGLLVFKRRRSK